MNDMVWYGGRGRLRAALQLFAEDAEAPETSDKFNRGREPAGRAVDSGKWKAESETADAGAAGEAEILRCAQKDRDGEERIATPVCGLARNDGTVASDARRCGGTQERAANDRPYEERRDVGAPSPTKGVGEETDCHTSAAALVRNDEAQAGAAGARNDEAQAGAAGVRNDEAQAGAARERLRAQVRGELAGSLARYRGVLAQAAELERALPGFSLDDELNDPQFAGLLAADVPVRTAFEVVHHRQLQEAAFALAARRAAQSVASILALNERRPKENAVAPSAAAVVEDDPRQLTRKERRALRERVRKGEKVVW